MLIQYPVIYTPENSLTYAFRQPVPIRYACPILPPGFLSDETDGWNCNLCGSASAFYAPYVAGDIIPFQTQFADNYNVPTDVITAGFQTSVSATHYVKVELQDCCGVTVSEYIDDFCEVYWVGYSVETGSIQTWFVNTGLFPTGLECFRLKITYYRDSGAPVVERTLYTEYYKEVANCGGIGTALIESTYPNYDCNGNYYGQLTNTLGLGNAAFYNSMRIEGEVEFFGESESVTENDRNVVIKKDITENYGIISGVVPPYFIKRLAQTVRGNAVTVDGIQYQNFSYDSKPETSKMFLLDLTFNKKCSIDNRTCG
jgi:hypothetical protein